MRPPYGWKQREEPEHTLFVGFEPAILRPFPYLIGAAFGFSAKGLGLGVIVLTALAALVHGFRIKVSAAGISMWWTLLGIPYWCHRLPIDTSISTSGSEDEPDDEVVIVSGNQVLTLGSTKTCHALCEAIQKAQQRWQSA